ncbi:chemokine-like receptor 1 [Xenopus laevis]|uniref:Chemokine-like receptor 1 n=2 Tax=Xenopus laevis TaxID=8355 RepID=A0A1L8EML5_XENLA|nr:chemokine-like receptor 1 [Xenopus laevis]XP_018093881.1 chemokine-like receptor 1 [Xenopus laevis]XP_041434742.1 chemokine-like receptor 1 [Xenopus laevis]OCT60550.1 hypothetical protein XELAEV_18046574mg [Xenopus laevis]
MDVENVDLMDELENFINASTNTSSPTVIQYASFIVYVLTCIIGLIGNAGVILISAVIMQQQKCKIWFLNLAVADFLFLLILPLYAASVLKQDWLYGSLICKLYHFMSTCNMYSSIFIITALNIDRVLSVAKPIWHLKVFSRRVSHLTCAVIWVTAFLFSLPVIFLTNEHKSGDKTECGLANIKQINTRHRLVKRDIHFNRVGTILDLPPNPELCLSPENTSDCDKTFLQMKPLIEGLIVPFILIGYFIPLCTIILSNIIIAWQVNKSHTLKSSKLYRIVMAVILIFFLTWTPLVIAEITYITAFNTRNFPLMHNIYTLIPLLTSIAYTNCCLNPIIYVLVGRQVRTAMMDFIYKRRNKNTSNIQVMQA